ncbi:MAG TPA: biotin/lipoyl-containing protein [Ktedonobacteraceae bacterium]|nr:biotin/lipoyl-containing protein [Ktedonobacteraceae bacterium]
MDGNQGASQAKRHIKSSLSQHEGQSPTAKEIEDASVISVEQLDRLVRLLDRSDVFELELKQPDAGTRLVLRKARAAESNGQPAVAPAGVPFAEAQPPTSTSAQGEMKHVITAHLVGFFHVWAKPRGGALVAVGDRIKMGQLVATIQSLNIINEVESTVAGRVVEILVQDGQPVEYGQHLMVIDSSEGA